MGVASACLCDTLSPMLPVGWERRKTGGKAELPHYYYNTMLRISQWEHPSLTHWRSVLHELLSYERKHLSQSLSGTDHAGLGAHGGTAESGVPGDGRPARPTLWVPATE